MVADRMDGYMLNSTNEDCVLGGWLPGMTLHLLYILEFCTVYSLS